MLSVFAITNVVQMRQDVLHLTNISARTENAAGDLGLMMNKARQGYKHVPMFECRPHQLPLCQPGVPASTASGQHRQYISPTTRRLYDHDHHHLPA